MSLVARLAGRRRPAPRRRLLPCWLVLVALATAPAGAVDCPSSPSVSAVRVSFVDLDEDGVADLETRDQRRNEHARLSSALATELGVVIDGPVYPQVRVVTENQTLANGHPGTGVFSIFEIYDDDAVDEIQVWADDPGENADTDSGEYRLFEDSAVADLEQVRVTVHALAPSHTTFVDADGASTECDHFAEPHADSTLVESVTAHDDRTLALLVPHGGEIEAETSTQIAPLVAAVGSHGVAVSTWDVQGHWHDDQDESEHWHITSKEIGGGRGFPGFAWLVDQGEQAPGRAFRRVASLHGMRYSKEGLLLGGRAHREAKCLVASRVRHRMWVEGLAVPAIFVWDHDDDLPTLELAHGDGDEFTITAERGSDPGLSGLSSRNIVNRLSPNEGGERGHGGIQIEQSPSLRDTTPLDAFLPATVSYLDLVSTEIGHALGILAAHPDLVPEGSTAVCDALLADQPALHAELSVVLAGEPHELVLGGVASYTVDATSAGPDWTAGVRLEIELPPALQLEGAVGPGWTCDPGTPIVCRLAGRFDSGASTGLGFTLRASDDPVHAGASHRIAVHLSHAGADFAPTDDLAEVWTHLGAPSDHVFTDGFEQATTAAWSATQP